MIKGVWENSKNILEILNKDNERCSSKQQQETAKQLSSKKDFKFSKTHLPSNNAPKLIPIQISYGQSVINNLDLIHDYKSFDYQSTVRLFSQKIGKFPEIGGSYTRIIFDHGSTLYWNVLYAPNYDGAVLLSDRYDYQFDQIDTDNGKVLIS